MPAKRKATRSLAIMKLSIRGIEADIGKEHADTFRQVEYPDLRSDYVIASGGMSSTRPAKR
jgi:type I restriction enzyme M protein